MPDTIVVNNEPFDVYISQEQIRRRVKELAAQIDRDYAGKVPIFIGIFAFSIFVFSFSLSFNFAMQILQFLDYINLIGVLIWRYVGLGFAL